MTRKELKENKKNKLKEISEICNGVVSSPEVCSQARVAQWPKLKGQGVVCLSFQTRERV